MCPTDIQFAVRDNDHLIGPATSVPDFSRRPVKPRETHFGTLFDNGFEAISGAKSLVLEDFTRKSFKLKELAGISP